MRGFELFDEGAYDAALLEMKRAFELAPSYKLRYNIGLLYVQLRDYASAVTAFDSYLAEGGNDVAAERAAEVRARVRELTPRTALLRVEVDARAAGADIVIDDEVVGEAPLMREVRVNSGRRVVVVSTRNRVLARMVVEVAGGDRRVVQVSTDQGPAESANRKPMVAQGKPVPWAWWGGAGMFAVGTVATGVVALKLSADHDALRRQELPSPAEVSSSGSRVMTWSVIADAFFVSTIIVAGVATYLTLTRAPSRTAVSGSTPSAGSVPLGPFRGTF